MYYVHRHGACVIKDVELSMLLSLFVNLVKRMSFQDEKCEDDNITFWIRVTTWYMNGSNFYWFIPMIFLFFPLLTRLMLMHRSKHGRISRSVRNA